MSSSFRETCAQIRGVIKSRPSILDYDVRAKLEPHAEWLEREGLTARASIGKVICKYPQVKSGDSISALFVNVVASRETEEQQHSGSSAWASGVFVLYYSRLLVLQPDPTSGNGFTLISRPSTRGNKGLVLFSLPDHISA